MLKFSGFADLTSCLEWNQYNWNLPGKWPATEQRMTHKCYSNCLLWSTPVHWMRQRHEALWHTNTHTWQHQTSLVQCVRGMNINRHWSRHAFRDIPKAQYTFKSLLVHGILQFTMFITLRCALHRCSSRDIRRWKLWREAKWQKPLLKAWRYKCKGSKETRQQEWDQANLASHCCPRVSEWVIAPRSEPHRQDAQWFIWMRANDPSAGSPTETLLRLLLPLSDKVH